MNHPLLDEILKIHQDNRPKTLERCYPRRYVPAHGYLNPIYLGSQMACHMMTDPKNHIGAAVKAITWRLIEHQVPTYFVEKGFIAAVAATEPPGDWTLSQLRWPLEAMAFILPLEFIHGYAGRLIPFLSMCRLPKGEYKSPVPAEPANLIRPSTVINTAERMMISWPVIINGLPIDYSSSYPLTHRFDQVMTISIDDVFVDDVESNVTDKVTFNVIQQLTAISVEEDKKINEKMNALAIKLILAMAARPEFVEKGQCLRKAKAKHGRMRDELWSPNIIGRKYRVKRGDSEASGISHRMHWRRGHFRDTPFGPLESRPADKPESWHRLVWIEPVLVNAPVTS